MLLNPVLPTLDLLINANNSKVKMEPKSAIRRILISNVEMLNALTI